MYLNYYNLSLKPFEISPDPKFLWLGEKHKEALAVLKYGILENKGFLSLTGDIGTGKTTIVNALANSLGDNIIFAKVLDPSLDEIDFFKLAANVFKVNKKFSTKGDFLSHLEQFLIDAHTNNKDVVLIIEEAQRIDQELLEEVRLLSNIEQPDKKLITIIFVGQIEFNKKLTKNRALRQRITINYEIEPLTNFETEKYISHRLKVAGSESKIFSQGAIHEIFSFSGGNPRLINIICDLALLSGYAAETKIIQPDRIRECADNFQSPKQHDEGGTKAQIALTKTIKEIRASKALAKLATRKFAFLSSAAVIILTCALGFFYFDGYDAFSKNTKPILEKTSGRFTNSKLDSSIQQPNENSGRQSAATKPEAVRLDLKEPKSSERAQTSQLRTQNIELTTKLEQLQSTKERVVMLETETAQREQKLIRPEQMLTELTKNLEQEKKSKDLIQAELVSKNNLIEALQEQIKGFQLTAVKSEAEIGDSAKEIAELRVQLTNLKTRESSAASQLSQLRTQNIELTTKLEQLQSTKERVAMLETETAQREQKLIRSEQMLTELTKNLEQEKKSKNLIQADLVLKDTLIKELQRIQQESLSSYAKLKSELEKSKVKITTLRNQLLNFQAQKVPLDSTSVIAEKKEDLSVESDTIEPATESPKPGDIIDWIIKKKSQ